MVIERRTKQIEQEPHSAPAQFMALPSTKW